MNGTSEMDFSAYLNWFNTGVEQITYTFTAANGSRFHDKIIGKYMK